MKVLTGINTFCLVFVSLAVLFGAISLIQHRGNIDRLEKTTEALTVKMEVLTQVKTVCHCDSSDTCSCAPGECHCPLCQSHRTFNGKNVTEKTIVILDGKSIRWEDLPDSGTLLEIVINDKNEIEMLVLASSKK